MLENYKELKESTIKKLNAYKKYIEGKKVDILEYEIEIKHSKAMLKIYREEVVELEKVLKVLA